VNQDFLKLNKNILIGALVAWILAAITAFVLSDQVDYLLTTYTVLAEYVGFFGVFFLLFYLDNKKNYKQDSGKKDKVAIRTAFVKLGSTWVVSEIIYISIRWLLGYYLLTIGFEPNIATILSQIVAFTAFIIAMNVGAKFTKLYKHQK
jgi:undecaprenyl pyrophosphate phosphatase UppP